jgi:hypothetical protein
MSLTKTPCWPCPDWRCPERASWRHLHATSGNTGSFRVTTIDFNNGLLPTGFATYDTLNAIMPAWRLSRRIGAATW